MTFGGKDLRRNKPQNNTNPQRSAIFIPESKIHKHPQSDYGHDGEDQKWDEIQPNVHAGVVIAFADEQDKFNKGPEADDGELCRSMSARCLYIF